MLTLNDGRSELWQWDTGRKLTVDADCTQVHFSNKFFGRSVDVDVFDGTAAIPDVLLQVDNELIAWAFVGTPENGYTKISKVFKVNKRNKPADYVFTPPEQTTLGQIMERLDDLEAMQDPDAIKNAVDDYLANNPIKVEEKDPTVPDWAKQTTKPKYTATEVGAVAKVNGVYPDTNGNVTITVSDSGGNVELDTSLTQSGKAADAKAVGDALAKISGVSMVEPAEDDIPKVFFGGPLQQTKTEAVVSFRYISKTEDVSGYAEIKAQGNSSMNYAKKNQTVKLYKDAACEEKLKIDFKGWGKQSKFCFKANWIDLTHARNVVSARLWADVVKSRANYAALPELLRTSPNQGAVDGFPIKVYAGGVYQGRYTLNIPKDAWMANMDDELDSHCILCGEGYVSGCFRQASVSQWTDEVHDSMPSAIRTRWLEVINFVMNSTDEDFKANLGNYFDVESLLDYHLFGLLSCGLDAYGKNQLYMTYDGQKWIASMYDMDSTWGLWWTGAMFMPSDYDRSEYQDFKDGDGNLLYIRLENLFYEELYARWAELRSGALSIDNIINRFERFTDIASEELVKEDYATTTANGAFSGIPSKDKSNIQQIRAFAVARHAWTDEYIRVLVPVPCTGVSLSQSAINFTKDGESVTLTATLTPTDTTDKLTWESSDTAVATVENGVVTLVGMGNAVITARCGARSATCAVVAEYVVVPCTGITLSASSLTFTEAGKQTLVATVEPANTTDAIAWSVSPAGIVTVENGVVTAVENGACAVTATCGEKSATCSVTVSGIFVAGEVDYSINPLENAVWVSGEAVVEGTGVIQTKEDTDRTEKIVVPQTCTYKMTGGKYMRLSIWDSEDNYVGQVYRDTVEVCLPAGYKFVIQAWNGQEGFARENISLAPVDYSASATYQVVDLSTLTWNANTSQGCIEGTMATAVGKIDSSNYPFTLASGDSIKGPTTGGKLFFGIYSGALLIMRGFGTDATAAAAYFAENGTKLILNARQA